MSILRLGVLTSLPLAASLLYSDPAHACGGLFCSASNPVEQTAERIVFADNADGSITTIIEVQYEGPSEQFAWLLPMPGTPTVDVSTVEVLNSLDLITQPQYELRYNYGEDCEFRLYEADTDGDAVDESEEDDSDEGEPGIEVLDSGSAGPYDYVTISADPELEDAAEAAIEWLVENGYDVFDTGPDVLRPYLAEGLNLIAFRLTKGNDAGAIRPVQLTYQGDVPSIPIRPTAVAAVPDMGIRVFLLGDTRYVSSNYLSLELNEARINWFDWRSNYDEVVALAANEAGGHGFVTEYADDTEQFAEQVWDDFMQERWVEVQSFDGTGAELMMEAVWPFRPYEGFRRAVELSVNLPEGLTLDEFASDPVYYEEQYGTDLVDSTMFLDALEREVVVPLKRAQALLDSNAYMTRLFTTLSPEEMNEDPLFIGNPDLEDVSNYHEAKIDVRCAPGQEPNSAPYTITLADGTQIHGEQLYQELEETDQLPAAKMIVALSDEGEGEVLEDNSDSIQVAILEFDTFGAREGDASTEAPDVDPTDKASEDEPNGSDDAGVSENKSERSSPSKGDDDSCSVAAAGSSREAPWEGVASALLLLGAALLRRQRRD